MFKNLYAISIVLIMAALAGVTAEGTAYLGEIMPSAFAARYSDKQLMADLRNKINTDITLTSHAKEHVICDVKNGKITLGGTVTSVDEKLKIENYATELVSRDKVINNIKVGENNPTKQNPG